MLKALMERRAALKASLEALNTAAVDEAGETRSFTPEETTVFDDGLAELKSIDARIAEVQEAEAREARAAAHRVEMNAPVKTGEGVTNEPNPVYRRDSRENSYFKDLAAATLAGSGEARTRLIASQETRALGNTGAVGGSGGEFAPPVWLINDFIALARPARVFANLVNHQELPSGVSSVNIPKISGGTTVAIQTTQNTALSQTDLTTTSVSSGISTIGGKQVVAQQLLDQSGIPFDTIILQDLAADYARQLDTQFITGSGAAGQLRGVSNAAGVGSTAYTDAAPAVAGAGKFYATLAKAIAAVSTTRFLPPTAIVMHPRRWGWISASFDTQNRPLLPMNTPAFNAIGDNGAGVVAAGAVGVMQGLPVYVDANIATNTGAGLNQDPVYVLRLEDVWLWESQLRMETFTQPYADSAGVLFRALAYSALVPDRYGAAINVINGTGTITPVY
jgi:HK97 family phage major capsid protein